MDIKQPSVKTSAAPKTVLNSIEEKYSPDDPDLSAELGYIIFHSNSPETKKGMFPPIMTLIDYDIESVGESYFVLLLWKYYVQSGPLPRIVELG